MKRRLVSFDWAMKKLLRSKANFDILEGFLSELLGENIKILEILESEGNKSTRREKTNRLDVKVKNEKNEIVIVEVQYDREYDYLQRILFHASKAVVEHMDEGQTYSRVVKVVSVNILYFDLGQGDDYVYHGKTCFRGLHNDDELRLSEKQRELFGKRFPWDLFPEYYLIKVNNFNDVAKNTLDEWVYFLKNEEIKDNFKAKGLKKAKEQLDILKLPDKERLAYDRYSDELHYEASMVESSYGSGKLDGRKEGRAEGKIEIARNLLLEGLPIETVVRTTGLSLDEVKALDLKKVEEEPAEYKSKSRGVTHRRVGRKNSDE